MRFRRAPQKALPSTREYAHRLPESLRGIELYTTVATCAKVRNGSKAASDKLAPEGRRRIIMG